MKVIVVGDMTIQLYTDNLMVNVTNGSVFVYSLFKLIYSSSPLHKYLSLLLYLQFPVNGTLRCHAFGCCKTFTLDLYI